MNHLKTWSAILLLTATLAAQEAPKKIDVPVIKQAPASEEPKGDRPDLRRDFDLLWFGGEPSAQYLDYKKARAKEEMEIWAHTMPGYRGDLQAIPGTGAAWINLGPKKSTFSVYSGAAPTFPDVDAGRLSVVGILTHPTNPQILYLATSGGGLWKTTNADLATAGLDLDTSRTAFPMPPPRATSASAPWPGRRIETLSSPWRFLRRGGRGFYKSVNGGTAE